MKKSFVLCLIFTMLTTLLPNSYSLAVTTEPIVKVKLVNFLGNTKEVTLKPNGDYKTNEPNIVLHAGENYLLKQVDGKLVLSKNGNLLFTFDTMNVTPLKSETQLSINNRPYLGSFDFIVENGQYVRPINSLLIEDYLKGVVPIEMYPSWNIEALKTQAVAARTYAYSYLSRGIINDTISYQVYGGYIWTSNTTKAVEETRGQVLQYNGRLIDAVYSASNGGVTESNANSWGNTAVPYLPIKQDSFDPKTIWKFSFHKTQIDLSNKDLSQPTQWWTTTKEVDSTISANIKAWLSKNGFANKDIKIVSISDLSMHNPTSGGRVSQGDITIDFLVKDKTDVEGKLIPQHLFLKNESAAKIRSILGNRMMLSALIDTIQTEKDTIRVQGFGDGHGVGLSQWGSKFRADAGQNYEEILKFYYSGVDIVPLYGPTVLPFVAKAAPIQDKVAPIIKDVKATYVNSRKKVTFSYAVNESSIVTIYVKNSNGTIISYLESQNPRIAGTFTVEWDVKAVSNGNYTFGILTKDSSGNSSSSALKYNLNKHSKPITKSATIRVIPSNFIH